MHDSFHISRAFQFLVIDTLSSQRRRICFWWSQARLNSLHEVSFNFWFFLCRFIYLVFVTQLFKKSIPQLFISNNLTTDSHLFHTIFRNESSWFRKFELFELYIIRKEHCDAYHVGSMGFCVRLWKSHLTFWKHSRIDTKLDDFRFIVHHVHYLYSWIKYQFSREKKQKKTLQKMGTCLTVCRRQFILTRKQGLIIDCVFAKKQDCWGTRSKTYWCVPKRPNWSK